MIKLLSLLMFMKAIGRLNYVPIHVHVHDSYSKLKLSS